MRIVLSMMIMGAALFGVVAPRALVAAGAVDITASVAGCGDSVIQSGEECDSGNLNGETCATLGFPGTGLSCNADCTLATSSCVVPPPPPPSGGGGGGGGGGGIFFGNLVDFVRRVITRETVPPPLPPPAPGCPSSGDLNRDCRVDIVDFSILVYALDRGDASGGFDLSGDGRVDLADFSIMVYHWTD